MGNWVKNHHNLPWIDSNPVGIYDGKGIIIDDSQHSQAAISRHDPQDEPYLGRTYIANNIVRNFGGRGIHAFSSAHVDIVNNTICNNLLSDSEYITEGKIDAPCCDNANVVNSIGVHLNGKRSTRVTTQVTLAILWDGAQVPFFGTQNIKANPRFTEQRQFHPRQRLACTEQRLFGAGAGLGLCRRTTPGGARGPGRDSSQPLASHFVQPLHR